MATLEGGDGVMAGGIGRTSALDGSSAGGGSSARDGRANCGEATLAGSIESATTNASEAATSSQR
jgi:hypothetical protein